jgi:hypothetical protein
MPFQGSPPSVSVSGWERGRYQINIQFHSVSRASLCRKDNAAAAGSPGIPGKRSAWRLAAVSRRGGST